MNNEDLSIIIGKFNKYLLTFTNKTQFLRQ